MLIWHYMRQPSMASPSRVQKAFFTISGFRMNPKIQQHAVRCQEILVLKGCWHLWGGRGGGGSRIPEREREREREAGGYKVIRGLAWFHIGYAGAFKGSTQGSLCLFGVVYLEL